MNTIHRLHFTNITQNRRVFFFFWFFCLSTNIAFEPVQTQSHLLLCNFVYWFFLILIFTSCFEPIFNLLTDCITCTYPTHIWVYGSSFVRISCFRSTEKLKTVQEKRVSGKEQGGDEGRWTKVLYRRYICSVTNIHAIIFYYNSKWIGYNHSIRRQIQICILYEPNETWLIAAGCQSKWNTHTYTHALLRFYSVTNEPIVYQTIFKNSNIEFYEIRYTHSLLNTRHKHNWIQLRYKWNGIASVQVLMMEFYFSSHIYNFMNWTGTTHVVFSHSHTFETRWWLCAVQRTFMSVKNWNFLKL